MTEPLSPGARVVHVRPGMWRSYPPGTVLPAPNDCMCGLVPVRPDDGSAVWVLGRDQIRRRTDEDDAAPRT